MSAEQPNQVEGNAAERKLQSKIWAIGGGKGGVGKSIISLNLAYWFAKLQQKVVLVDADLGGANLHTLMGMKFVHYTLADYLNKKVQALDEIAITTPASDLRLICGASDIVGLANPKYQQKVKLLKALQQLDTDHLILDLGAGTDYNTLDFFLNCDYKIIVITPQPTSIQNGYGFIKSAVYRSIKRKFGNNTLLAPLIDRATDQNAAQPISSITELIDAFAGVNPEHGEKLQELIRDFHIHIIANNIRRDREKRSADIIRTVTEKYLGLENVTVLGSISHDPEIEKAIANMKPAFMANSSNQSALEFYEMVYSLIKENKSPGSMNLNARAGARA